MTVELGAPGAKVYAPTEDDILWMRRAVQAEGPKYREVAQALINRFMWLRSRRPKLYPTLARFVRAYSQPVNPRWLPGGSKYKPENDPEGRRAKARRRASARTEFKPAVNAAVKRALLGPLDLPTSDTMDFGTVRTTPSHLRLIKKQRPQANDLYSPKAAKGWTGYYPVHIEEPEPAPKPKPAPEPEPKPPRPPTKPSQTRTREAVVTVHSPTVLPPKVERELDQVEDENPTPVDDELDAIEKEATARAGFPWWLLLLLPIPFIASRR